MLNSLGESRSQKRAQPAAFLRTVHGPSRVIADDLNVLGGPIWPQD